MGQASHCYNSTNGRQGSHRVQARTRFMNLTIVAKESLVIGVQELLKQPLQPKETCANRDSSCVGDDLLPCACWTRSHAQDGPQLVMPQRCFEATVSSTRSRHVYEAS